MGFLLRLKNDPGKNAIFSFGPVQNQAAILSKGGPDTTGWRRIANNSEVNHALNEHKKGTPKWIEGNRLSKADIARIPDVIKSAYDVQVYKRKGAGRIKYKARIGERTYTYVETIGGKRRQVIFKTMWWRRKE